MLESREGVEQLDEILATEGLDGVSIGTTDLSKSLGVPGDRNHRSCLGSREQGPSCRKEKGQIYRYISPER